MTVNRLHRPRSIGKRAACLAGCGLLGTAVLAMATGVAGGAEAPDAPTSYEAVASAEGVRFSFGAPGFTAVDTFIDGGGPVSQSVIDGLGNSRAFASLPYPGDLAISGPGLLAGLTGLPSPPPYPFYVVSSHPTTPEAKVAQPGYELIATSTESSSQGSTMTGGAQGSGSSASAIGSTMTKAVTSRDAASGVVTAEATGTADVINIGGVLRIGQVDAKAKVTRGPGTEPTREASFVINGMMIAGQTVGFSEKGFTFGGTNTPIPQGNPLTEALKQAKITVQYLTRIDNPDGVVSPGLVIRQEQATPGGPTMVIRYVFGQMAASATVSGSPTSIGDSLSPIDTGPSDTQVISPPADTPAPAPTTTDTVAPSAGTGDTSGYDGSGFGSGSTGVVDSGSSTPATSDVAAPTTEAPAGNVVQEAAPISRAPMTLVDTSSIYLILVAAAVVALGGGTVLRLMGVKLKWAS
jgi:hypothetical protein